MTLFLILLAASYLAGAIPFALIIAKMWMGIDIRKHGSGNVGATNTFRVVGMKAGLLTFAFDFAKGFVPTLIAAKMITDAVTLGGLTISPELQKVVIAAAAVIGHCFPVYLMTYGGKGIATSIGVFAALMPWATLAVAVIGLTILFTTGYMAIASCLSATLLPLAAWWLGYPIEFVIVAALLAVMIDLRHQGNWRRFFKGIEPKVWDKAAPERDEGISKPQ